MEDHALNVCVLGHSYICRLRDYLGERDMNNFNLDDDNFTVELRGRCGLSLKKMVTDASFLDFDSTPGVVFLQIRGNDIRRNTDPNRLASYILFIGEYLVLGLSVQLVIIRRAPHATCAGYNRTVFDVNGILRQRISGVQHQVVEP